MMIIPDSGQDFYAGIYGKLAKTVVLVFLLILFRGEQTVDAKGAGPFLKDFRIECGEEDVDIVFAATAAVDLICVPVADDRLWGAGKIGRTASARSESSMGIGTRIGTEPWILIPFNDDKCRRIRVWPIFSESAVNSFATAPWKQVNWRLEGVLAFRRVWERLLDRLIRRVASRQTRDGCFSCHELMPLGVAAVAAWDTGLSVPIDVIASLTDDLVKMQQADGAFRFSKHPEYGEITPTLFAAAVLDWSRRWKPDTASAMLRAVRYLVGHQSEDGSLLPDFSFPPWMIGASFFTRLYLRIICQAEHICSSDGKLKRSEFSSARTSAEKWIKTHMEVASVPENVSSCTTGISHPAVDATHPGDISSEEASERFTELIRNLILSGDLPAAFKTERIEWIFGGRERALQADDSTACALWKLSTEILLDMTRGERETNSENCR
ncbi:MAG: hypothetical protein HQM09_02675 [Candidatus Riflebacteria bacterium]|nr:hypothetical protein [Candidatus Riflebacteria bacterium]